MVDAEIINGYLKNGFVDYAQQLIKTYGLNPDLESLNLALENGSTETAILILFKGVQPNVETLNLALKRRYNEIASLVLDKGVEPNLESLNMAMVMYDFNPYSITRNFTQISSLILEKGVEPNIETLNIALRNGYKNIASFILSKGVEPNIETLTIALKHGYTEITNFIIKKWVEPNIESDNVVVRNRYENFANIILGGEPNVESLNIVLRNGYKNIAGFILKKGVKPNTESLNIALNNEFTEIASLILKKVKPTKKNLQQAALNENQEMVCEILDYGVIPNEECLMSALKGMKNHFDKFYKNDKSKSKEITRIILEKLERTTEKSLNRALILGYGDSAKLILAKGARPDINCLKNALKNGLEDLALSFLDQIRRVQPNIECLNHALKKGLGKAAKRIMELGILPNSDSVFYAVEGGLEDVAKEFLKKGGRRYSLKLLNTVLKQGLEGNVQLLIYLGVKPDATSITAALEGGLKKTAADFVENGVKPDESKPEVEKFMIHIRRGRYLKSAVEVESLNRLTYIIEPSKLTPVALKTILIKKPDEILKALGIVRDQLLVPFENKPVPRKNRSTANSNKRQRIR